MEEDLDENLDQERQSEEEKGTNLVSRIPTQLVRTEWLTL